MFIDASWTFVDLTKKVGFVFISIDRIISLEGCCQIWTDSIVQTESLTLEYVFKITEDWQIEIDHIFMDYAKLLELLYSDAKICNWHIRRGAQNIQSYPMNFTNTTMEII